VGLTSEKTVYISVMANKSNVLFGKSVVLLEQSLADENY
jgi:hypothetical protein